MKNGVLMKKLNGLKFENGSCVDIIPSTDTQRGKIFGIDLAPSEAKTAIMYSDGSVEVLDNEETK